MEYCFTNPLGFTYLIEFENHIKIGQSANPLRRIRELSTAFHCKPTVLGLFLGGKDVESRLHAKFNHLRKRGEWFSGHTKEIHSYVEEHCFSCATEEGYRKYGWVLIDFCDELEIGLYDDDGQNWHLQEEVGCVCDGEDCEDCEDCFEEGIVYPIGENGYRFYPHDCLSTVGECVE